MAKFEHAMLKFKVDGEYNVFAEDHLDTLIKKVNSAMDEGFVPIGGIGVGPAGYFYQAVVKPHVGISAQVAE